MAARRLVFHVCARYHEFAGQCAILGAPLLYYCSFFVLGCSLLPIFLHYHLSDDDDEGGGDVGPGASLLLLCETHVAPWHC